jgi:hypothetical protein
MMSPVTLRRVLVWFIVVLAEGRCMTLGGGIIMTCIALPHNIVSSFRLSSCYMSVGV